jgi:hypothetical protein
MEEATKHEKEVGELEASLSRLRHDAAAQV